MKNCADKTKKFVVKHKTALAVTGTVVICLYLNHLSLKDHNNFLKDHDLFNTFYEIED